MKRVHNGDGERTAQIKKGMQDLIHLYNLEHLLGGEDKDEVSVESYTSTVRLFD